MKRLKPTILLIALLVTISSFADNDKGSRTQILIETTMGNITVALYNETPVHRDNFIKLVKQKYFDGLLFHRVIKDFVIQGGDPDSKNAEKGKVLSDGGPGYSIPAEINYPDLFHKRGALAAARESDDVNPERRSSGSQFYIVWGKTYTSQQMAQENEKMKENSDGEIEIPEDVKSTYELDGGTPQLDGQYTVFGEVIDGLKTVQSIQKVKTDKNDRPIEDVKILRATIISESK